MEILSKKEIKKLVKNLFCRNSETKLVIAFLVVACLFLYCRKIESQAFIGIVASIIAVYFGLLKQKIDHDRMFKELFESFNSRYNAEINDIFNDLRRNPEKQISDINKNGENLIIDYFNLCAEEYLWFTRGRIPKEVWKAWKIGIKANLKILQVKVLYDEEMKDSSESYYGLNKELGN
jgi:hypothetical protein